MKEMLTDRVLAFLELEQDLLYGKIPEEKRGEYIEGSLRIGREKAGRYAGKDIFELYKQQGIAIVYRKETKGTMGVMLRGQAVMSEREKRVELYQSSIESLAVNSSLEGKKGFLVNRRSGFIWLMSFFIIWNLRKERLRRKNCRRCCCPGCLEENASAISAAVPRLPPMPLRKLF